MASIKLHLDQGEYDAVARLAEKLSVRPEDIAYAGLNRVMMRAKRLDVRSDIVETAGWRRDNLPLWSDSASSCHAYEAMPDDEPTPSKYA